MRRPRAAGPPAIDAAMRAQVARAVAVLRAGGLVAFPTETVYGLGADARNAAAVRRIFAAKGRPADHPLIVHIEGAARLAGWCAEVPPAARMLADAFWPGPLTLVLERAPGVPDEVTGGQDSIGLRVPAHPVALALLQAFGGGIAAPSANRFGHVSPTTAAHVQAELGDAVDLVLDGGPCQVGIESTIVDVTATHPRILRPGGISRAQVDAALRRASAEDAAATDAAATDPAPRVPGTLASHYAPDTAVCCIEVPTADASRRAATLLAAAGGAPAIGVLAIGAPPADQAGATPARLEWRRMPAQPGAYARRLYARLRELDELGLDLIVIEAPPDTPAWEAVRDRLRRAGGLGRAGR